ncbi:uncharacterized protein LOC130743633 [Lotus japonicus]|uniref:uncharacterized protein LOC130743633 n=1 Tax=Lotus japonicus TaxID=34305 RepID=UPI00258B8798|nr:uncharacterized protein LOC130743633 [Lotus japonicus]
MTMKQNNSKSKLKGKVVVVDDDDFPMDETEVRIQILEKENCSKSKLNGKVVVDDDDDDFPMDETDQVLQILEKKNCSKSKLKGKDVNNWQFNEDEIEVLQILEIMRKEKDLEKLSQIFGNSEGTSTSTDRKCNYGRKGAPTSTYRKCNYGRKGTSTSTDRKCNYGREGASTSMDRKCNYGREGASTSTDRKCNYGREGPSTSRNRKCNYDREGASTSTNRKCNYARNVTDFEVPAIISQSHLRSFQQAFVRNFAPQLQPNPPNLPPVPSLRDYILGCSRPIEKELQESDVNPDQNRLLLNKNQVENFFLPLLMNDENLKDGIAVTGYDMDGKEHPLTFKKWADKYYVFCKGWKTFFQRQGLKPGDFVTVWMFRHSKTNRLCVALGIRKGSNIDAVP